MAWLAPVTLSGQHAVLEPLHPAQADALSAAVRDGELYKLWYTAIPTPEKMGAEIERRLGLFEKGAMLPFAVKSVALNRMVGMTTYMNVDQMNKRVEIGATWYAKSVQRSPLNTECKLMLLGHAFEKMDCIAVEFRTSFFNQASRAAIARLGARQDGILRNHQRHADGSLRDTVVFSITAAEWPAVKMHLQFQLSRPRA
ncbi:MAG TPA: GNAT family protein [Burkholderiales bacterium]|jgi:RimJ/RimL family protein N-acetyltransferase